MRDLLEVAEEAYEELKRLHKESCGHDYPEDFPCICDNLLPKMERTIKEHKLNTDIPKREACNA